MKKFLIVLIIIFICGIMSADICLTQIKDSAVLVGIDFYEQYANAKLAFKDVFWNVLYERAKLFGILLVLCFTPIKEKIGVVFAPVFSFVWGFFLMSCIVELGVAGLIVGLASVFPHGLLYGGALLMVLSKRRTRSYHTKDRVAINAATYIFMVLLFITGCVIESLIGTHFIPWVIRLSLI